MRLPWISPKSFSRGSTRRQRPAPLRVRRLERRRVLDAAISELVLSPADLDGSTAVHDTNEGTQVNASANATGFGDLFYEWTLRKDGAIVEKSFDPTYSFTPQDNGNFSLTVAVTDSTQSTATETREILVHNVRPVLIVAQDQMVDEGSPLNLSALSASPLGLFIDPGLDDTHTVTVNWGDGSPDETPTTFQAMGAVTLGGSHTYADNGVFEVIVTVTDDDGGSDTKSFFVTVGNVAPTATLENSGPVDEGSSATVSFVNPFDPSVPDTAAGFRYAYDFDNDGVFEVGDGTYAGSVTDDTQLISAALLADGPATRTVRARILDKDGGFTDYTTDITVNNVAPTLINITVEDDTLEEGDTAVVRMTIDDAGALDVFEVEVDWQDGSAVDTIGGLGLVDAAGMVGSTSYEWDAQTRELTLRHVYVDDNPTGTPSDTYAVALTVRDDDLGGSGPYTVDVTVANVRPVLTVAPDQTVDEGAVLDLSAIGAPPLALFADVGVADTHTTTVDWGDGSDVETPTLFFADGSGTLGATHVYEDNGVYTVTVTVTDDDGGTDSQQFQVTVSNVAPQLVNLAAVDDTIDEGDSATISMNIDDPGPLDTFEIDVDWRDGGSIDTISGLGASDASGTVGDTAYEWIAATRQLTVTHLYVDDNPTGTMSDVYGVLLVVRDNDLGESDPYQVDVTVSNVRPVLTVAQDQEVNEGTLLELTGFGSPSLALFIDAGVADTHTVIVNWGDGTGDQPTTLTGGGGSFAVGASHTYLDSGTYTVMVTVTDDDGGVAVEEFQVTVINVAPTGVLSNSGPIDEGSPATVSFSDQFDPSPTDTAAGFRYAYDFDNDGVFDVGDGTYGGSIASSSELVPPALVADGPATLTVKARIIDKDGGFTDYTTDVTVNNVAPELINIVVEDATINEGQTATITATINDPGADTFEVDVDWKDNGPIDTLSLGMTDSSGTVGGTTYQWNAAARQLTVSHLYVDDNPTGTMSDLYTVTLAVRDDDGGETGPYDVGITVSNVRPVLVVAADQTVDEGSLVDLSGVGAPSLALFIDEGVADTHTVIVNWGDGTGDESGTLIGGGGSFAVGGTHTYVDDGLYTVTVTVIDDDGGMDMQSFQVTVLNVAPTLVNVAATDDSINEGQTAEIVATIIDPGAIDVFSVDVDWHDGDPIDTITGLGLTDSSGTVGNTSYTWTADTRQLSVRHLYADDNPTGTPSDTYSVELVVRDDDLAETGPYAVDILVSNLRPVLVVAADQTVDEGSLLDLSASGAPPLALFIDSGKEDTHTVTVNWGDGSGDENVLPIGANGSFAVGGTHIYADDGEYTVTVTVVDDDGGVDAHSFSVTVLNVDPSLAGTEGTTVEEGEIFTLVGLGIHITDPGFDNPANPLQQPGGTAETFEVTLINWGDGNNTSAVSVANRDSGEAGVPTTADILHPEHAYADNGAYTVEITLKDDDGDFVVRTFEILVTNVHPTMVLEVAGNLTVNESQDLNLPVIASFSDPGFDNPNHPDGATQESFSYFLDWGDGRDQISSATLTDSDGAQGIPSIGQFGGMHNYADNGVYTVTIRLADDDMSANFASGVAGVDFVELTFTVTVNNVGPMVTLQPNGQPLQGDDLNTDGITTIRISYTDPGYDNLDNTLASNGGETVETFDHVVQWGDGTVDAIHQYTTVPGLPVVVTMTPNGGVPQVFDFGILNIGNPVITLVSSQSINDPSVPVQLVTYEVDWGDGHTATYVLNVRNPGLPIRSNGLTELVASTRVSGNATTDTMGSAVIRHRFTGPPNPLNPTAKITIVDTLYDDDGASVTNSVTVSNPGIQTINVAIDTTPDVARLDLTVRPLRDVFIANAGGVTQLFQGQDVRGGGGEVAATTERYLELRVVHPDGTESEGYRIKDEALLDLREFFATLPDGRYAIYLVRTENHSERLVIEVDVRRGRVIDVSDDSEGTRDRPPTSEESQPVPLDENPLLEQLPAEADAASNGAAGEDSSYVIQPADDSQRVGDAETRRQGDTGIATGEVDDRVSLSPTLPLSLSLAALAALQPWSARVDTALAEADEVAWRRLRGAGRRKRAAGPPKVPLFRALRAAARLDYNNKY